MFIYSAALVVATLNKRILPLSFPSFFCASFHSSYTFGELITSSDSKDVKQTFE